MEMKASKIECRTMDVLVDSINYEKRDAMIKYKVSKRNALELVR
jgi:hypothetical protein